MRAIPATLAASLALLAGGLRRRWARSLRRLRRRARAWSRALNSGMRAAGSYSGAYVQDLTTGQVLYNHNASTPRLPASVEKLLTTSTALLKFGAGATLTTSVLGVGQLSAGTLPGTLYLRGGGDPTLRLGVV